MTNKFVRKNAVFQAFFRVKKICLRQIVELLGEAPSGASPRSSSHTSLLYPYSECIENFDIFMKLSKYGMRVIN